MINMTRNESINEKKTSFFAYYDVICFVILPFNQCEKRAVRLIQIDFLLHRNNQL